MDRRDCHFPCMTVPVQEFNTEAYRVTYDWTLSPRMLNHLSVGGNKFDKIAFRLMWVRILDFASRMRSIAR